MTRDSVPALVDVAISAARAGGDRLAGWPVADSRVETKSSPADLVSDADRAAEGEIDRLLSALRPGDGIAGEEGGERIATTGFTWIVDPLDGTTNFLRRIPYWATSVAVRRDADGATLTGAVYAPALGRLYSAGAGHGARLERADGTSTELDRSAAVEVARALIGTGFSYDPARRGAQLAALKSIISRVGDLRRLGTAALDLCAVADGSLDGFVESDLKPHDYAAGVLIAAEAGVRVSGRQPSEPPSPDLVLAAVPGIYDVVLSAAGRF